MRKFSDSENTINELRLVLTKEEQKTKDGLLEITTLKSKIEQLNLTVEKLNIKISEIKDDCDAQLRIMKADSEALNLKLKAQHKNEIEEKEYFIKNKEIEVEKFKLECDNLVSLNKKIQNQMFEKNQSKFIRYCRRKIVQ